MFEKDSKRAIKAWIAIFSIFACCLFLAISSVFASSNIPDNTDMELSEEEQKEIISRNSPLASYVYLSPNADFPRDKPITKITIHHMADDDTTLERLGKVFGQRDRQASSNYAIDGEGRIAIYVEEANRAWTSSSAENDNQAVTIEVENSEIGEGWKVSDASYDALIELCADICKRNGIERLSFTGKPDGNLTYHKMFDNKTICPGPFLENNMGKIASDVNARL